ncbi:hypothetical protein [Ectobacillus ponti]|uniref:Phage tail protein n=1 Tax=Ectobacillus ponti TaxID=2961894 RepID=A0AA41XA49_9BACI|nr:hypothetical protein [Ectobacillus ponti]MCP8969725.1 hypothetical protein [Ectobacillus ponti]
MSDKNDVVIIELDRPRELRYGHKALKKLTALTGKGLDKLDTDNFDLEEIEKVLYCGLLSDAKDNNETLKLEDMEDLLDQAPSYGHIMEKMQAAFNLAFGQFEDAEKN